MFGFLRIKSCGLEKADKQLYHSHFCSLCHSMREFGGLSASLLTNYDMTFWLIVCSALLPGKDSPIEKRRCTALPFQKVSVQPVPTAVGATAAALNIALVESKLEDDVTDGEGVLSKVALRALKNKRTKARRYLREVGYPVESITRLQHLQSEVESRDRPSLDSLSEPTAQMMTACFVYIAQLAERLEMSPALGDFGAALGRFLYLWDAVDDFEDDRKRGRFNALQATDGADWNRSHIRARLMQELGQMRTASEVLDMGNRQNVVTQLLNTLQGKVAKKLPLPSRANAIGPRATLAVSGFVKPEMCCTGPCDCCGGDVGCCGCNLCEGGCCSGDSCCELNLCKCCCCGGDDDSCCSLSCCNPCCCCRD
jgi:Family of unknown function (DUF5685)